MQAVEDQTLILYHTDLRGQWPQVAARAFATQLPYIRRLAAYRDGSASRASLAGVALALRALTRLHGRAVQPAELVFADRQKPRLAMRIAAHGDARAVQPASQSAADFSISHADCWVGCAAMAHGRVGFDIEAGDEGRVADWVVREALLKATGEGLRAVDAVRALELDTAIVSWRGTKWHLTHLDCFPGAVACIASSLPVTALEHSALTLDELFPP